MKKLVYIVLLTLLSITSQIAIFNIQPVQALDPPIVGWQRTFGGIYDDGYHEVEMVKPSVGGYAVAGWTESYGSGSRDAWLIKTDECGNHEWNQTYGGSGTEWILSIIETSDGGYALFGHTNSYGEGQWDYWLVKTDANGNMEWFKTYGGSGRDEGRSIVQTPDGGYALAGFTNSFGAGGLDYWIVKTDPSGNVEWDHTYGGSLNEYAYSIILCEDGFAVAGQSGPHASSNAWLLKIDSLGNHVWDNSYGGTGADLALSAVRTIDGGYALAGPTRSYGSGGQDFWLVKTDQFGTFEWQQTFGGLADEQARYVIQTDDGGYAVFGSTESKGAGDRDFWLVKTDSNGNAEWDQTYGGGAEEWGDSLVQTSNGAFVLAGWTKSYGAGNTDIWLIKLTDTNAVHKLTENAGCHVMLDADWSYVYFTEYLGVQSTGSVRRVKWTLPLTAYPTESEVLFHGEDPFGLTIDSEYIYFMIHGDLGSEKIMKISKEGGPFQILGYPGDVRGCRHTWDIVVDPAEVDQYIYFAVRDGPGGYSDPNGYIGKIPKSGGSIEALTSAGEISYPTGIAIDEEYLYFSQRPDSANAEISRIPKEGGEIVTLTNELQVLRRKHCKLEVDSTWVYFTEPIENGRVGKVAKDTSGTVIFLAENQDRPVDVAVDAEYVYFTERGTGKVKRVPKNGGCVETIATGLHTTPSGPHGVITRHGQIFFTDYDADGGVYMIHHAHAHISSTVDIDPNTLNLMSRGNWITGYIELPIEYDVSNIDVSTILLNDTIPAESHPTVVGDYDSDGIPDLMVKFNRAAVIAYIRNNAHAMIPHRGRSRTALTIKGSLLDGTLFQGTDTISVLFPMPR